MNFAQKFRFEKKNRNPNVIWIELELGDFRFLLLKNTTFAAKKSNFAHKKRFFAYQKILAL